MVYLIMASDVDKGGNKTKKTGGIALIISCVLVLSLFYSVLFRPQKEISIEENRTLQKVPAFSVKAYAPRCRNRLTEGFFSLHQPVFAF